MMKLNLPLKLLIGEDWQHFFITLYSFSPIGENEYKVTQAENEAKNAASLANKASEVSSVSSVEDRRE